MVSKEAWERHLRLKELKEKMQLEESKKMEIKLENEESLSQSKIWKMKGFKSLHSYQEQLARSKGFWSYESYLNSLAQQEGFETRAEELEHVRQERELQSGKENRNYLDKFERKRLLYCNAINRIAPKLQDKIRKKNTISMTMEDLAKKMGKKFETRSVYFGAKYCLFDKGIVITSIKKDHEPINHYES